MEKPATYQAIDASYQDPSEVPRGKDLFYQCLLCGDLIPSVPLDSVHCRCRNLFIDKDYMRFDVEDLSRLQVVKKIDDHADEPVVAWWP